MQITKLSNKTQKGTNWYDNVQEPGAPKLSKYPNSAPALTPKIDRNIVELAGEKTNSKLYRKRTYRQGLRTDAHDINDNGLTNTEQTK